MTSTTMNATTLTATPLACPESRRSVQHARPQGLHRVVMVFGMGLERWAQSRADQKAMARAQSPLSALSDHERVKLYREATQLREQAYADRGRWHVIG